MKFVGLLIAITTTVRDTTGSRLIGIIQQKYKYLLWLRSPSWPEARHPGPRALGLAKGIVNQIYRYLLWLRSPGESFLTRSSPFRARASCLVKGIVPEGLCPGARSSGLVKGIVYRNYRHLLWLRSAGESFLTRGAQSWSTGFRFS